MPDLRARLLRIEDTRRDEPALVDSLLASPDPRLRAAAALTAGRLGGAAHRAPLRRLAADPDHAVAASALFALGLLKDTASAAAAEQALLRPGDVAVQGAWLLGELGEPGRSGIVRGLQRPTLAPAAHGALLLASARLRPVPAAAVVPWLAVADTGLAWRAAYVLARGRSAAGVRPLLAIAGSSSSLVRQQVARGLSRAVAGDSLADPALAALNTLASDADPFVRVNAVRSLATYGRRGGAPVRAALRDRDAGVRLTAAQLLESATDSAVASWTASFAADTAFVIQRAVADGAARRGIRVWDGWISSPEWHRRAAAAELDAVGPATIALSRLVPKLADGDGRVRAATVAGIARLADSAYTREPARTVLREALRDDDVGVRTAALGGLASGADSADLLLAIESYERSRTDRDADARLAFWAFADSALRRPIPAGVETRLAALPRPADPLERAAAAKLPRFAPWRDETSVARPLAWYAEQLRWASQPRVAVIETERGTLEVDLFTSDAPLTTANFAALAGAAYFDGQRFHRVVPNFVVQAGDPRGDGNGGPGHAIRDEINPRRYLRGTMGMALSGPHTGGSQWFIAHSPQPHLDGGYTVFGALRAGGDTLDRIVQGDRIVRITIR